MMQSSSRYGADWTHDELVLALYLYCQLPFAKTKANNPEVIRLAHILQRTPASVARKLGNFGAFDPLLAEKGIIGLGHYSKADKAVWQEFHQRWDMLVEESRRLLVLSRKVQETEAVDENVVLTLPKGPTVQRREVTVRLCQSFFRRAVLASYGNICCFCGIDLPALLIASHIIPWAEQEAYRTDPQNGLCLCALHDRAFDRGLISIANDRKIIVASAIRTSKAKSMQTMIGAFAGVTMQMPSRFPPNLDCLQWHREHIFQG